MKPKLREALAKEMVLLREQGNKHQETANAEQVSADRYFHEAALIKDLLTELPKALPKPGSTTEGKGSGEPVRDNGKPKINKDSAKDIWGFVSPDLTRRLAVRAVADTLGDSRFTGPLSMMISREEWPHWGHQVELHSDIMMCAECKVCSTHTPCVWCGAEPPSLAGLPKR